MMDSLTMSMQRSTFIKDEEPVVDTTSLRSAADTLQAIQRQTVYLQREIQALLDAQSVGLLAGLGQEVASDDGESNSAASTGAIQLPLSVTGPATSTTQRRHTKRRRPSLSTSRKYLHRSLLRLAELKDNEASALEIQRESLTGFLENASALTNKKTKIESAIQKINSETEDGEKSLAEEEQTLVQKISDMERTLADDKARLKHIRQQRSEGTNRRTARLSSWTGALSEVDRKIKQDVLHGRGLEVIISNERGNLSKTKAMNIWTLPQERRTVELVHDDLTTRVNDLETKRDAAERENIACSEGAEMWKSSVKRIEDVEQLLFTEMSQLSVANGNSTEVSTQSGMIQVVDKMTETIDFLEHELDTAEVKGWNLLVCAIGAELEALQQGKDLLQETLHLTQDESTPGTLSMMTAKSRMASDLTNDDQDGSKMVGSIQHQADGGSQLVDTGDHHETSVHSQPETIQNSHTNGEQDKNSSGHRGLIDDEEDDDDDAPGPEFLIEHDG